MRNGSRRVGFKLDHSRPLQPIISITPARTVVPSSHHNLDQTACPRCTAASKVERVRWQENMKDAQVVIAKSAMKRMQIHSVGT